MNDHDNGDGQTTVDTLLAVSGADATGWIIGAIAVVVIGVFIVAVIATARRDRRLDQPKQRRLSLRR